MSVRKAEEVDRKRGIIEAVMPSHLNTAAISFDIIYRSITLDTSDEAHTTDWLRGFQSFQLLKKKKKKDSITNTIKFSTEVKESFGHNVDHYETALTSTIIFFLLCNFMEQRVIKHRRVSKATLNHKLKPKRPFNSIIPLLLISFTSLSSSQAVNWFLNESLVRSS